MAKKQLDDKRRDILDNLRQCERDLMDIGTEPDALRDVRAAIRDLEREDRDRAGIFARDFIPR